MFKSIRIVTIAAVVSSLSVLSSCTVPPWEDTSNTYPSFYSGAFLLKNNKSGKYFSYAGRGYDVQHVITDHCPLNYLYPSGGHSIASPGAGGELPGAGDYQVWFMDNSTNTFSLITPDEHDVRRRVNFVRYGSSPDVVNLFDPESSQLIVHSGEFDQVVNVIPLSIHRDMPESLWTMIPFPSVDHFNGTFFIESHYCNTINCLALTVPDVPVEFPSGCSSNVSTPTGLITGISLRNNASALADPRKVAAQLWKLVPDINGLFTIRSVLAPDHCITKQDGGDPRIMLRAVNQGSDLDATRKRTGFSLPPLDFLTGYRIGPVVLSPDSTIYLWWNKEGKVVEGRTDRDMPNVSSYPGAKWNIIPYSPPLDETATEVPACTMTWRSNCNCTATTAAK